MDVSETLKKARDNLTRGVALQTDIAPDDWGVLLSRYADFIDERDGDGHIVAGCVRLATTRTPRPYLHQMASCHERERGVWGSYWDQFGGGFSCMDSVLAGRMTSHLDTNYVPTAPEPQDYRGFYVHENGDSWPMFPRSGADESDFDAYVCDQGLDRQVMRATRNGLACELQVVVHPELSAEVWRVTIVNRSDASRAFSWFASTRVNVDSYPFYYFVPRVVCEGIVEDGTLVFLNHDGGNTHKRAAFFTSAPAFDRYDMAGETFHGIGARSGMPEAVVEGACRNSPGLQPYAGLVAAAQFDAELASGDSRTWTCVYGACPVDGDERRAFIDDVRGRVLSSPNAAAHQTAASWAAKVAAFTVKTPDAELDRYFNVWSRYQARNQARFTRALDKVGYRDVLQDLLGVCDCEPTYVRTMLLRALHYQLADGRAIRQFEKFQGGGHDMRMYRDSPMWICDLGVLDERVPYFDMNTLQPDPDATGTVYEHALAAVRSLSSETGYHGLCKIGYGDWNDALSRIGGEKGVSVWLSAACVFAARKMEGLCRHVGRGADAEEMRTVAETVTSRINEHAWDGAWYIYAINDKGDPIGSASCDEGRLHLNVNTWALFTGVAEAAGRADEVWNAVSSLDTPVGHRLLSPSYTTKSREGVGRIADQLPGMFENGSIYTHGESFFLYALAACGRSDECYAALKRSLPSSLVPDIATGPRHQQSNFTVGPDHPNFGAQLFSNSTGSISWYRRVVESLVGVRATFDGLAIDPHPPAGWDAYEVKRRFRGRDVRVLVKRGEVASVSMRGVEYHGTVPVSDLRAGEENLIEVTYC